MSKRGGGWLNRIFENHFRQPLLWELKNILLQMRNTTVDGELSEKYIENN
jgi:hypothetical protein